MVLMRLFQTSRRFQVEIQPQLVLLQKTLLNIEGLGRQLDPDLDLWHTAKPFLEKWMLNQIGPKKLLDELRNESPRYAKLLPAIVLYLSYFLLLSAARSAIDSGRLPHWPGMFLVPLVYLLLIGVPLNLQGTSWWNGVKGHFFKGKSA